MPALINGFQLKSITPTIAIELDDCLPMGQQKRDVDESAASSIGNILRDANKQSIEPSGNISNNCLAAGRIVPEKKASIAKHQVH